MKLNEMKSGKVRLKSKSVAPHLYIQIAWFDNVSVSWPEALAITGWKPTLSRLLESVQCDDRLLGQLTQYRLVMIQQWCVSWVFS